ncbi:MAG: hypothetical protein IT453_17705 [Planctomycetes bacterium]|nr:hypothetical protein [Planctomycetota bacterium]
MPLGQYVAWPHAGDYRVKLLYHDETDIADDASVAGRILSSSPEFTVRVLPRKLEVTKAELARLRQCIGELDVDAAVTLVSGHWHEELRFEREPATAEDHLFRGGWTSVVVLLDALRDQGLEPKRRAVVLGMLWNIVGLHNPTSSVHAGALGAYRWLATWPGAIQPARRSMAEFGDQRGELDLAAQRKLSELWLALRDGIELSVTD